jgi:hypothetical protein
MRSKRTFPRLPVQPVRGRVLVTNAAVTATEQLLPTYRGPDGDHEGIVFWCGREMGDATVITTAIAPDAKHSVGRVMCDQDAIEQVSDAAHALGLGVLAQVHSHPGPWTEHSEGDDYMVLMPFEGMLSLVVPHYARHGLLPLHSLGVHQFQDGRWVLLEAASVRAQITLAPCYLDLR